MPTHKKVTLLTKNPFWNVKYSRRYDWFMFGVTSAKLIRNNNNSVVA